MEGKDSDDDENFAKEFESKLAISSNKLDRIFYIEPKKSGIVEDADPTYEGVFINNQSGDGAWFSTKIHKHFGLKSKSQDLMGEHLMKVKENQFQGFTAYLNKSSKTIKITPFGYGNQYLSIDKAPTDLSGNIMGRRKRKKT
jgi:hypothetical protein